MVAKILCAVDGSHASDGAVAFAVGLARQLGVPLCFLAVEPVTESRAAKGRFWDSRILDAVDSQDREELSGARRKAEEGGVADATCVVVHARDVDGAIVDYAQEHGFDHIVAGHTGRTATSRVGSVAYGVTEKAHCPVTIVH